MSGSVWSTEPIPTWSNDRLGYSLAVRNLRLHRDGGRRRRSRSVVPPGWGRPAICTAYPPTGR